MPQRDNTWLVAHTPATAYAWNANTNTPVITDPAGCCCYALKVGSYVTAHSEAERSALPNALRRSLGRLSADAPAARRLHAVVNAVLASK